MEKALHIKTPFFTAGRMYGWEGKTIGLGINLKLLDGDGIMKVRVGESKQIWVIDKALARDFIKKYKSIFEAKGTRLGVIAWDMFIREEDNKIQTTLFS